MTKNTVYLGVKGSIVAFDKNNGKEQWRTHLKGRNFVSLVVDEDVIFAHTSGYLYCVEKESGEIKWINGLSGLGYGMGMLGIEGLGNNPSPPPIVQKILEDQAEENSKNQKRHNQQNHPQNILITK